MKESLDYCPNQFNPSRRKTIPVRVGNRFIGGDHNILIQSMTNTNTRDIEATVEQTLEMANAGCELVRITAPIIKDAEALEEIVKRVRATGCDVPISADIHFQPKAAMEAVKWVEKVRINPGNYVDKGIMHMKDWTDEEWASAEQRVFDQFSPLVLEAKRRGRALRIGTNHGSLSGRMVFKYGDSVEGMVESAIEYLKVCEYHDFHDIVFSMKASNPKVVIEGYRMLANRLDKDHKAYPFHVGVTEAGEGEDGRLKSAVGIGGLLLDGIGDTIRVSLTESPVEEIPVAEELVRVCALEKEEVPELEFPVDPFHFSRRKTSSTEIASTKVGGEEKVIVGTRPEGVVTALPEERPLEWLDGEKKGKNFSDLPFVGTESGDVLYRSSSQIIDNGWPEQTTEVCLESISHLDELNFEKAPSILWSCTASSNWVGKHRALVAKLKDLGRDDNIILRSAGNKTAGEKMLTAAQLGVMLCDGVGDMVHLQSEDGFSASVNLAYDILQAAGIRRTKTEFISCPSCGRTLFDLEEVTAKIKEKTGHLKDVSIAVMGCIVNGPGEMADADFGYVGGAPNKIHLYVGKEVVQKNIPEEEATDALVQLIKDHGKWIEPAN